MDENKVDVVQDAPLQYSYLYRTEDGAVFRESSDNKVEVWKKNEGFVPIDISEWDLEVECMPCTEEEAQRAIERWNARTP